MKAIKILVDEHDYILKMIAITENILKSNDSSTVDLNHVESIVDFIKNFADKYHHLKEEDNLFVKMEEFGMPREGGPIGVMINEHNQGRHYIKLAEAGIEGLKKGDTSAYHQIQDNLLNYCELLIQHIGKENNVLYPMAERIFPTNVDTEMTSQFETINTNTPQNEYYDKYIKMVVQLSSIYLGES